MMGHMQLQKIENATTTDTVITRTSLQTAKGKAKKIKRKKKMKGRRFKNILT